MLKIGRRSESVDEATFEHGNEYLMYMLDGLLVSDFDVDVDDHFESRSWMFSIAIVNICSIRPLPVLEKNLFFIILDLDFIYFKTIKTLILMNLACINYHF